MNFADIILRIGTSIGGWVIFLGHSLLLSVVPRVTNCSPGDESLARGTLLMGVLSLGGLIAAGRGLQWAATLRWLAGIALAVSLLGWPVVIDALQTTTLAGESLCQVTASPAEGVAAVGVERAWAPVQLAALLLGLVQAIRTWRAAAQNPAETAA